MQCKIDHGPDGMPAFLCRHCHPELNKPTPPVITEEVKAPVVSPEIAAMLKKHRVGKLRKEERKLSKLIDEIGSRDPVRRGKLYESIRKVEKDIERELSK